MRKAVINVMTIFMCIFLLAGCYRGNTLEERINQREIDYVIDELKKDPDIKANMRDVTLEVKENSIYCNFYFKTYLDDTQIVAMKSALLQAGYEKQIIELKDKFEKQYKIRPDLISYAFYTSDDRLIGKVEG
ncbi:MAG: hypothetical protein IKF31_03005 [Clostridiales bacterium]|jgi:hypothetical protein|nr:hypothetical protein [Clostridiales bacterium]